MTTPTKDVTKTVRKTRPAAKTGDPQADRVAAQKAEDAATPRGRKPVVHIAAADTASTNGAQPAAASSEPAKPATVRKPAKSRIVSPVTPDGKQASVAAVEAVAKAKPAPAPVSAVAAKIDKRAAKQELGLRAIRALAEMVAALDGSELALVGMNRKEAAQAVANWIHHVPVDRSQWPAGFPKPDRSDWK